ncbi:serine hydrolase [Streptomyces marokkonensis]|uniref:serine hydrolase n=1 Tax=Streptomyces marokkonensis TaxID=324855 RepID=UPI0011F3A03E|nr:serine hydrolase [Streptomyces marokkonensis]
MGDGARVSVAVQDLGSRETVSHGDGTFVTASIVKVDILAALLLGAQDAGREPGGTERAYAEAMIVRSDNDAASALWDGIGRAAGLDAANARLGLTRTAGGEGTLWGLTRTTAEDQLVLLRQVFGGDSELGEASRAYLRGLMARVVPEQAWGVPTAADEGTAWAVKNGWLPRDATGLWVVHSIGCVTAGGRECLVSALSDGNATKERGVARVEGAVATALSALDRLPHPLRRPGGS